MRQSGASVLSDRESRLQLTRVANSVAKTNFLELAEKGHSQSDKYSSGKKAVLLELLQKGNRTNYGGWLGSQHSPRDSSVGSMDAKVTPSKQDSVRLSTRLQMDDLAKLAKLGQLGLPNQLPSPRKKQMSNTLRDWKQDTQLKEVSKPLDSVFKIFRRNSMSKPTNEPQPYLNLQNQQQTMAEFDEYTATTPSLPKEISFTSRGIINGAIKPAKNSSITNTNLLQMEPSYSGPYKAPPYQVDKEYKVTQSTNKHSSYTASKQHVGTDISISGSHRRTDIDWAVDLNSQLPFALRNKSEANIAQRNQSPFSIQNSAGSNPGVTSSPQEQAFKLYPLNIEEVILLNKAEDPNQESLIDFSILNLKEAIELPFNQKSALMTDVQSISLKHALKQEDLIQNVKSVVKPKLNHERKDAKLLQIWYTMMLSNLESQHPKQLKLSPSNLPISPKAAMPGSPSASKAITKAVLAPVPSSPSFSHAHAQATNRPSPLPLQEAFARTHHLIQFGLKQLSSQLRHTCKDQADLLSQLTTHSTDLTNKLLHELTLFLSSLESHHREETALVQRLFEADIAELKANNATLKAVLTKKDEVIHLHERTMTSMRSKLYNDLVVIKSLRQENEFVTAQMELIQEENHKISKIVHDMNEATVGVLTYLGNDDLE